MVYIVVYFEFRGGGKTTPRSEARRQSPALSGKTKVSLSGGLSLPSSTPRRAPSGASGLSLPSSTPARGSGSLSSRGSSRAERLAPKTRCFSSPDPVSLPKGAFGGSSGPSRAVSQGQKRKAALSLPSSTPRKVSLAQAALSLCSATPGPSKRSRTAAPSKDRLSEAPSSAAPTKALDLNRSELRSCRFQASKGSSSSQKEVSKAARPGAVLKGAGGDSRSDATPSVHTFDGGRSQARRSEATPSVHSLALPRRHDSRRATSGQRSPSLHSLVKQTGSARSKGATAATPSVHTYCGRKPSGSSGPALCSPGFAKGLSCVCSTGQLTAGPCSRLPVPKGPVFGEKDPKPVPAPGSHAVPSASGPSKGRKRECEELSEASEGCGKPTDPLPGCFFPEPGSKRRKLRGKQKGFVSLKDLRPGGTNARGRRGDLCSVGS